jgi:DNA-binding NtrC family response regulator
MANILIVDDEIDMLETIAYNLERAGHAVVRARSGAEALERLVPAPDLIISDVMMPGMDGLEFCAEVRRRRATALTPFLFVTARGQAGDKYEGLRVGADDYVTKPFNLSDLLARVNGRLQHRARAAALESEIEEARRRWQESAEPEELVAARKDRERLATEIQTSGYVDYQAPDDDPDALRAKVAALEQRFPALAELRATSLVGESPAFLRQFEEILVAAASPDPILIIGEPGTGKTAVADAIFKLGPRAARHFRTLSCAELAAGDPTIAAGKLFGYGRNSGLPNLPREGQAGLLEQSDSGVLFLDEIGELPRQAQTLLLLPLEGRPFGPAVGAGGPRTVDVKFVCATNRDLPTEVEAGRFPRDLYERLAGQVIRLPSLRQRPGDVEILAQRLLREAAPDAAAPPHLDAESLGVLAAFSWPGNVRQLRNALRQAVQRARLNGRALIQRGDLGEELQRRGTSPTPPLGFPPVRSAATTEPGRAPVDPQAIRRLADHGFSEREARELAMLRACGFRVGEAEVRLGYSGEARTLSRRLKGMCFKALGACEMDLDRAAELLVSGDPKLQARVILRLQKLVDSATLRLDEDDDTLVTNLPGEYRRFALVVIGQLRQRRD